MCKVQIAPLQLIKTTRAASNKSGHGRGDAEGENRTAETSYYERWLDYRMNSVLIFPYNKLILNSFLLSALRPRAK